MRALLIVVVIASGCSQASAPNSTIADQKLKELEAKIAILEAKSTPSVNDDPEFKSLADNVTRLAQKVEVIRRIVERDLLQRESNLGSQTGMQARLLGTLEELFPAEELLRRAMNQ